MVTDFDVPDSPTNRHGCPAPTSVFSSHDILHGRQTHKALSHHRHMVGAESLALGLT